MSFTCELVSTQKSSDSNKSHKIDNSRLCISIGAQLDW